MANDGQPVTEATPSTKSATITESTKIAVKTPIGVKIGMIILGMLVFTLLISLGLLNAIFKNRYNTLIECKLLSWENKFVVLFSICDNNKRDFCP